MTRAALALGVGLLVAFGAFPAAAAEPHLEFVRALQERGMADLAADYLHRLAAQAPDDLKAVLPLELARARMEQAHQEADDGKRAALYGAARGEFEAFLKASKDPRLTAKATLELARLVAAQGKLKLAQARRVEGAARKDLLAQARPLFADAAARLKVAAGLIDAQVKALASSSAERDRADHAEFARGRLQAQLEEGINRLFQGIAMPDGSAAEVRDRARVINQAQEALAQLATQAGDAPAGWSARVWAGRCAEELDNKAAARKAYETVAAAKDETAADAARQAAYFLLRLQARDEQVPNRAAHVSKVIQGCEEWLTKYRGAAHTPDGQGVRYVLAGLLEEQVRPNVRVDPNGYPVSVGAGARPTLVRVEKLYKELAETDNDFTERARGRRAAVLVILMGERLRDGVARLVNFEECYLAAQVAAHELTQGKKAGAERAKLYRTVIDALRRGLALAGPADAARDQADARVMLAYAYLAAGDPYSAAVLGEHLGRTLGGTRGAEATAYALQAYARVIARDRERGAAADEIAADRRRLRALAEHMERAWPAEPVTDFARHQLGGFLLDEGSFADACAMLARIAPTYPGLAQARYQHGTAAQKAQGRDVNLTPAQKKALLTQAIAALEQVPDPLPGASEESNFATALTKLQLGNLLLLNAADARAYDQVEQLGRRLSALVPKLGLDAKALPQVAAETERLRIAGAGGRALLQLKAGRPGEARKVLAPVVDEIVKDLNGPPPPHAEEAWFEGFREVQRQALALALRVEIESDQADGARKALAALRKAAGRPDALNERLLRVVQELKQELDALKADRDAGRRQALEKGLSRFLDELARTESSATPEAKLFLAGAYSSLERHDRAAALLKDFPAPKAGDARAQQSAKAAQLLRVRALRQHKDFDGARGELAAILKDWGRNDLNARREAVLLLEDEGSYANAVRQSREVQQQLTRSRLDYEKAVLAERGAKTDDERQKAQQAKQAAEGLRERYWEFYLYELRSFVKNAQKPQLQAELDKRMATTAKALVNLEKGQEDFGGGDLKARYRELLDLEPLLKRKYAEEGGKKLLAANEQRSSR